MFISVKDFIIKLINYNSTIMSKAKKVQKTVIPVLFNLYLGFR